eukprot:scaffold14315_cov62-Phaeocystis_antarctica.AAC.3
MAATPARIAAAVLWMYTLSPVALHTRATTSGQSSVGSGPLQPSSLAAVQKRYCEIARVKGCRVTQKVSNAA